MSLFLTNKRYPAFTLAELMIGMIASGIVLSAIWMAFRIVAKLEGQSRSSKVKVQEISLFKSVLSCDFNCSDSVADTDAGFRFIEFTNTSYVEYKLGDEYVIRMKDGHCDTFKLDVSKPLLRDYEDQNINENSACNTMQLTIQIDGVAQDILLAKNRSAVELIRNHD